MVAAVNVLPDWRDKGVLKLEITKTNLDLLLEQPPAGTTPWTPTLELPNVYWVPSKKMVQCKYWYSRNSKYKTKSIGVEFTSEMDNEDKDEEFNRAARELQAFYDSHHNQGNDMPGSKRDRESDDDPSTAAAESHSVRKASKSGCEETEKDDETGDAGGSQLSE